MFATWEDQRNNGSQMIAFGSWAFGGDSSVVVTHSVYADFDHWTATRGWGVFRQQPEREEEARQWRRVFAGRNRLIKHSRAAIYNYDDALSEPEPKWREVGEPRVCATDLRIAVHRRGDYLRARGRYAT